MSNSRLEKFIYAICGMEVDDLPTPLSRIETLWNCLITGGTPDFEPLSRNEKYLMSMLTGDVDALPEPTSRSEKLLYKIATGETDLSDVPGYLSRYEELLKYLIENGGIGGTDFEYVLYTLNDSFSTLYSTAEAPVESAILKGQTLVNLTTQKSGSFNGTRFLRIPLSRTLKTSTKHFVKFNLRESSLTDGVACRLRIGTNGSVVGNLISDGIITVTDDGYNYIEFYIRNADDVTNGLDAIVDDIMLIEYQEGMENWDIPYFTGMQSVKMPVLTTTGKNQWIEQDFMKHTSNSSVLTNTDNGFIVEHPNQISEFIKTYINLKKGTWTISFDVEKTDTSPAWVFLQKEDVYGENITKNVSIQNGRFSITYTSSSDIENACLFFDLRHQGTVTISNIQLEQGSTATSYEPYKSNILTISEDVVLREIGDVQDTLDCLTGEVTERIGEIVLDGSEGWWHYKNVETMENTFCLSNAIVSNILGKGVVISNSYSNRWWHEMVSINPDKTIGNANNKAVYIIDKSCSTLEEFTNYLQQRYINGNPVIIQYPLETESIKTVDLSIMDQDGQPTKLKTFNDITHVSIEAEDLLPTIDLEVATKIEETLSSLPTQMIDISETQRSLNEKINEQAENIKEVSTAITEIRNDIL